MAHHKAEEKCAIKREAWSELLSGGRPMCGSDSVLYSDDKERQRVGKAKQMGLLCAYGQKGIVA